jgi:energy-coupling factor transporter ATP-binding protein EcfA2
VTIAAILVLEPNILILDSLTQAGFPHYSEIMEFLVEINKLA